MEKIFSLLKQTRFNILKLYEKHEKRGFIIPNGFKNNLYWNLSHCIATQQILCYKLSGKPMHVNDDFIENYKKGTVPTDKTITLEEILNTKELLIETNRQLVEDYNLGFFSNFKSYSTSYGINLYSIEDAIQFNTIHEGLHLGYMMAMVK
jgi:hypothetical protein